MAKLTEVTDNLPGALPTMWRTMVRAYHLEPLLIALSLVIACLTTVPSALVALWMKYLANGLAGHSHALVAVAMAGLAASAVVSWLLRLAGGRMQRKLRMRVGAELEKQVADLQASVPTIEHQERPDYLDRLAVLRNSVFFLDHMYLSIFSTLSALILLAITVGLLMSVSPLMAVLILFALPTVMISSWRSGTQRGAEESAAPNQRVARHLFTLITTAEPAKEVRLTGNTSRIREQWQEQNARWYRLVARGQWASAAWQAAAWAVFAAGYAAAVVYTVYGQHASVGNVLLVVVAGGRLGQYVAMTVTEVDFMRRFLDASRRLGWLEKYAAARRAVTTEPVPARLRDGISFEGVSFRYPGTQAWVLRDLSLTLPAGAVVAIVGENGAGKSTLVKLLCKLYLPTNGRITVDGTDLSLFDPAAWRDRLAGAFQDFSKFEFQARRTIGLGDLDRRDDVSAVAAAVDRAGALDVLDGLPDGLATQLGNDWPGGVEISFGQWQKLALARGLMRDDPLLTVLDEPTAALDAETENALFERYAEQSRINSRNGRITILVSHRFSTVRMADLIVVVKDAHVVEVGSHDSLLALGGTYADLYQIQARAYQ
jgi:ATP-binding cassette, subfamily B, bacterial